MQANLFSGASVKLLIHEDHLDNAEEAIGFKGLMGLIVTKGDTTVQCENCKRLLVEDSVTHKVVSYLPERDVS